MDLPTASRPPLKRPESRAILALAVALGCLTGSLGPAAAQGVLALRPGLPDRSWALASADFDVDGRPDLLAANFKAGDLSLFRESALGEYVERSPSPFVVLEGPVFIATTAMVGGDLEALDLNGDQRPDAVIVDLLGRALSVRLSDPDLVLKATANLLIGPSPQAVAVADFTGDKRLDLAVTSETNDLIYLFSGKGDGTFTFLRTVDARDSAQKSASESVGAYGIAAADFNRDGRMDLAVTQRKKDSLAILLGNGNGTFQTASTLLVGRNPTHLQVVRLNDDQAAGPSDDFFDLAVLLEGGRHDAKNTQETPLPGGAALLLGSGNGTFAVASTLLAALSDSPVEIAAGKIGLGQAGFDDLALVNVESSKVLLYAADGNGGFSALPVALGGICVGGTGEGAPCSVDAQCPGEGTCGISSSLRNPRGITLMDRDGNGIVDRIAVSNFEGYSISFFDGGGLTPFSENSASPFTATRHPVDLAAGSLDTGSGDDLAVLSSGDPTLQTFSALNNGFFFKRRATPMPAGSGPSSLILGDFNRDSILDAVVALTDTDGSAGPGDAPGLAILRGSGNSTFGSPYGLCAGGTEAGISCSSDADCPGGVCSYSPIYGVCNAGTNLLKACATDADCPSGTCVFTTVLRACSGGTEPGKTCASDADCTDGTCTPWSLLSGAATSLLGLNLNPQDADMDGVSDAADNCPALYNPDQANTRGLSCSGGTNPGASCTIDADCLEGGTCSIHDLRGDACDSTTGDLDEDLIVDNVDNCPEVYNSVQADADSNRVGDACDHAPDLVVLESGSDRAEIFVGRMDTGFFPPVAVPLGAEPAGIATGNFTAGDTIPDLAVTDRESKTFQIFAGSGTGGFTPGDPPPGISFSNPGSLVVLEANPTDLDLDGQPNSTDNCPTRYNPDQADADGDGGGDACSQIEDPDGDLVLTRFEAMVDNCPDTYNHDQANADGDRIGDACDNNPDSYNSSDDNDLDGIPDATDNCPTRYNPDQRDSSGYGVGDACDEETDDELDTAGGRDGILTAIRRRDNCPDTYNPGQENLNLDRIGDACEGVQDLVLVDEGTDSVEVIIQSPPGAWARFSSIHLGDGKQPRGIVAVDLNQDGYRDLVVSNAGDSTLSVLMGQGDGTFAYKTCADGRACNSDGDCLGSICRPDPSFSTVYLPGPLLNLRSGFFRRDTFQDLPEVAGICQPLDNPVILSNIIPERADVDGSSRVDGKDLAIWAKSFGLVRGNWGYSLGTDINLDGKIDGFDLIYIAFQFGKPVPLP